MTKHKPVIYQLRFDRHVYVGVTCNYWQRIDTHLRKMRYGHHTKRVQAAYDKFGEPKVGIIHYVTDDEYPPEVEASYIAGSGAFSLNQANGDTYEVDVSTQKIKYRFLPDEILLETIR